MLGVGWLVPRFNWEAGGEASKMGLLGRSQQRAVRPPSSEVWQYCYERSSLFAQSLPNARVPLQDRGQGLFPQSINRG